MVPARTMQIDKILLNQDKNNKPAEVHQGEINEAVLTYPQMGVYYDCMKRPTEVVYNVPSIFELPNETDINQLSNALREIVKAHPSLSTCFKLKDGNVLQVRNHEDAEITTLNITLQELENYKRDFVRPLARCTGFQL